MPAAAEAAQRTDQVPGQELLRMAHGDTAAGVARHDLPAGAFLTPAPYVRSCLRVPPPQLRAVSQWHIISASCLDPQAYDECMSMSEVCCVHRYQFAVSD